MSSLAASTREAVRARPFLYDALGAGVVNYTAAARLLDVDGETDAIATALRRYAGELPEDDGTGGDARVSMESGVGPVDAPDDALLTVGDTAYTSGGGSATAIIASGDVDATALEAVLGALRIAEITVEAAGVGAESVVLVVGRRDGPDALRVVERALDA